MTLKYVHLFHLISGLHNYKLQYEQQSDSALKNEIECRLCSTTERRKKSF